MEHEQKDVPATLVTVERKEVPATLVAVEHEEVPATQKRVGGAACASAEERDKGRLNSEAQHGLYGMIHHGLCNAAHFNPSDNVGLEEITERPLLVECSDKPELCLQVVSPLLYTYVAQDVIVIHGCEEGEEGMPAAHVPRYAIFLNVALCMKVEWKHYLENKHPHYTRPGSNINLPVIGSLVYCKNDALDQANNNAVFYLNNFYSSITKLNTNENSLSIVGGLVGAGSHVKLRLHRFPSQQQNMSDFEGSGFFSTHLTASYYPFRNWEIRTSISPSSAVWLNTTGALANYATEAGCIQIVYLSGVARGVGVARGFDSCIGNHVTNCRFVQIVANATDAVFSRPLKQMGEEGADKRWGHQPSGLTNQRQSLGVTLPDSGLDRLGHRFNSTCYKGCRSSSGYRGWRSPSSQIGHGEFIAIPRFVTNFQARMLGKYGERSSHTGIVSYTCGIVQVSYVFLLPFYAIEMRTQPTVVAPWEQHSIVDVRNIAATTMSSSEEEDTISLIVINRTTTIHSLLLTALLSCGEGEL
uniref:Uncharacterized protein n=1 Tax=Timema genevievae TaxID=629358 RepID=A0A7R9JRN2_TIMGE|nr:unnamed protein product [Timema genevievae]